MGSRFRELRLRKRPDLARYDDFGEAIHRTALTIRTWEREGIPSLAALHDVCEFLGVTPADFFWTKTNLFLPNPHPDPLARLTAVDGTVCHDGTTRVVLCVGPLAIKISRGHVGARCNQFEAEFYRTSDLERRKGLCPPLWCSANGAVLVMRRAERISDVEFDLLLRSGSLPFLPEDFDDDAPFDWRKPADWGWLEGRPVAVDYSFPGWVESHEANGARLRSTG